MGIWLKSGAAWWPTAGVWLHPQGQRKERAHAEVLCWHHTEEVWCHQVTITYHTPVSNTALPALTLPSAVLTVTVSGDSYRPFSDCVRVTTRGQKPAWTLFYLSRPGGSCQRFMLCFAFITSKLFFSELLCKAQMDLTRVISAEEGVHPEAVEPDKLHPKLCDAAFSSQLYINMLMTGRLRLENSDQPPQHFFISTQNALQLKHCGS